MNNPLAILFNLTGGRQVPVILSEAEARQYFQAWLAGQLPPRFGDTTADLPWAIRTEDICSVQILPVERIMEQQQGQPPPQQTQQVVSPGIPPATGQRRFPPGTSGLPC